MSGNNKNNKNRNNSNNKNNNRVKKQTSDLEKTGEINLTFDDERLEKTELLDISFIEEASKFTKEKEKVEELDLVDEKLLVSSKKISTLTVLMILVAFVLGFSVNILFMEKRVETKIKVEKESIVKNDENIVFLGDSLFDFYNINEYFEGRHVVNSGISGNRTKDILANMDKRVYRYNPSTVFLLIGTNDFLDEGFSIDKTVTNIGKIVEEIKKNRPYTEINVISLLPINNGDDDKISHSMVGNRNNEDITKINDGVKKLCDENKVTYIDMNSLLVDDNGDFDINYTTEGLHVTPEGYTVITNELMKYITNE